MVNARPRLIAAFLACAVWAGITLGVSLLQVGPGTSLEALVTERLVWATPLAALLRRLRATMRSASAPQTPRGLLAVILQGPILQILQQTPASPVAMELRVNMRRLPARRGLT